MTNSVASAYSSPFGLSGTLGLGTASILGGDAENTSPNAATVLKSSTAANGPLDAIASAANKSDRTATIQALGEGKLTNKQHNIIQAIGSSADGRYSFPWNGNGREPTIIATIRKYGWVKLVKPTYNSSTRLVTGENYELTSIGKAIFNRTNGSAVASSKPAAVTKTTTTA